MISGGGGTLDSFEARLKVRADALVKNIGVLIRNTTRAIVAELGRTTPVDEGTAVSNWQVSRVAPVTTVIPPYVKGKYGSTKRACIAGMKAAARAQIDPYRAGGGGLFISNNVPYINELNGGSSSQAPAGFAQSAILVGVKHVRGADAIISGVHRDG